MSQRGGEVGVDGHFALPPPIRKLVQPKIPFLCVSLIPMSKGRLIGTRIPSCTSPLKRRGKQKCHFLHSQGLCSLDS